MTRSSTAYGRSRDETSPKPGSLPVRFSPLVLALVLAAGAAGIAERVWLTSLAPRHAYPDDHLDNIQMGRAASYLQDPAVSREIESVPSKEFSDQDYDRLQGNGLTREFRLFHVYSTPRAELPIVWANRYAHGASAPPVKYARTGMRPVNYPPLGQTMFWLQTLLLDAVAPGRPANTFTSRLVMSIASILSELAAAMGTFLLGRRFLSRDLALVAAAMCWLLPPMALDSSFWGQTDSWIIGPALFTLWLMIRGRWAAAGILSAVAVLLKPQGLFLAPIVVFAAAILPEMRADEGAGVHPTDPSPSRHTVLGRLLRSGGAGAAVMVALVLPWTIADGPAWLQRAYVDNFQRYGETTLGAFNIWYADALRLDAATAEQPLSTDVTIAGVSKRTWGDVLVVAALVAVAALAWTRMRRRPETGLLWFSALWLWSTFLWPTQVHERYIVYAIPLVVLCSFPLRQLWPATLALVIVGSAETCANVWMIVPPGTRAELGYKIEQLNVTATRALTPGDAANARAQKEQLEALLAAVGRRLSIQRPWEDLLLALSLAGYAWALACPLREPRAP